MTDTTTTTIKEEAEDLTLEVTRRFKTAREQVFNAWSSLEAMSHWFGPEACTVLGGAVDFQVGGRYRLDVQTENLGAISVGGEYHEISPPERIAFSWKWEGHEELSPELMEVVIELSEVSEYETELHLIQTGFPNRESAEHHGLGWNGTFDKLGPWLASA
jgi:uncharacterized protein YndB with AHSA1/START domain